MKISYCRLCNLAVRQLYYENNIAAKSKASPNLDFKVIPANSTLPLLDKYNMVVKNNDQKGSVDILARIKQPTSPSSVLRFVPSSGATLTFAIVLTNPQFANYNDLPFTAGTDKIFYLNNLVNHPAAPRTELPLSTDAGGVTGADIVKKISGHYNYIHTGSILEGDIVIRHQATGLDLSPVSHMMEGGKTYISFDVAGLPQGRCELIVGGIEQESLYHFKDELNAPLFAIVELVLDTSPLSNYRIVEAGGGVDAPRPQFVLLFKNRATSWRYKLNLEAISPLFKEMASLSDPERTAFIAKLNIVSNDATISFNASAVSDKQFEFVSTSPIPFREQYTAGLSDDKLVLKLRKYIGDIAKEEDVKVNLPYPSVSRVDATTPPQVYSDVLLNL